MRQLNTRYLAKPPGTNYGQVSKTGNSRTSRRETEAASSMLVLAHALGWPACLGEKDGPQLGVGSDFLLTSPNQP